MDWWAVGGRCVVVGSWVGKAGVRVRLVGCGVGRMGWVVRGVHFRPKPVDVCPFRQTGVLDLSSRKSASEINAMCGRDLVASCHRRHRQRCKPSHQPRAPRSLPSVSLDCQLKNYASTGGWFFLKGNLPTFPIPSFFFKLLLNFCFKISEHLV